MAGGSLAGPLPIALAGALFLVAGVASVALVWRATAVPSTTTDVPGTTTTVPSTTTTPSPASR